MGQDAASARSVGRNGISPRARLSGSCWVTGARTWIGPGAVLRDCRLHDVVVESGAVIEDSILVAEGEPRRHRCDAAGRHVVGAPDVPTVGAEARVRGATLINVSVGARSEVFDSWVRDATLGEDNTVREAKVLLVTTGRAVRIAGPTEVSEALVGWGATIERRGYFEGVFSNVFLDLVFDEGAGRLRVVGSDDLPHVSRYGLHTVCSTNSGKLLPQAGGVLPGLGRPVGLWHDELLSHEPIEIAPCCWVAPWTKVIGQSPLPHPADEDLVNDPLATYLMPFSVAGVGGDATQGLVMPGELSTGFGPKQRRAAWAFTYAPGAVIAMVQRLREALPPERAGLADGIVVRALRTALEMVKAMAAQRGVDLRLAPERQRHGWPRWIALGHALLRAHLDEDLWRFEDGRPVGWRIEDGRWTHPRLGRVLALAPDALEAQHSEESLLECEDPLAPPRLAAPFGFLGRDRATRISPGARIAPDAVLGPGARIGEGCVIGPGAQVWRSVIERSEIGPGARVERARVADCRVGASARVRSSCLERSAIGDRATVEAAAVRDSRLAESSTVSAFADVRDVRASRAAILGGPMAHAQVGTFLMMMHMAGACRHLRALPFPVEMDGAVVEVPAVPMIGGGAVIRGEADAPVEMVCCFIGSNARIEANTFIGFGSFVLGRLGPDEGLLPFTLATDGDPARHRIGGVLAALPSVVITHFLGWAYQAAGAATAPAVARMVPEAVREAMAVIRWELGGRRGVSQVAAPPSLARYRSLRHYTQEQLEEGLRAYGDALASGAWDLVWDGDVLRFRAEKGRWLERGGAAAWAPRQ